ncbi:hypothetical protein PL373_13295 [Tenacibaculum maritimum]|nr:hypothetical protein [Tenacibaculum maritimum]MDB0600299.1 hypothetical protein [Tenacibaculum maritimum]MDB0602104.1 hypothetical protein [Tenacibaculum maritimum]MDB0610810.1 hypothetical protein [Tenacibaculum maritimum]
METTTKEKELQKEVDTLKDEVKELEDSVEVKDQEISDLEDEVEGLEEQVSELQSNEPFIIDGTPYDNLRGKMVFEKLFGNLEHVPINELESLVEKYAVL